MRRIGSAKSYIPEIPWNDSCASTLITNIEGYNVPYGANGFCNSPLGEEYFDDVRVAAVVQATAPMDTCHLLDPGRRPEERDVQGVCEAKLPGGSFGNPKDGVRDIPDVSLFAANGVWGHYYVFCYSDPTPGNGGAPCMGDPANWSGAGGTSFASPIVAGIQALVNQSTGTPQGNPNYVYYALAKQEYGGTGNNSCNSSLGTGADGSCTFYDVTQGEMM